MLGDGEQETDSSGVSSISLVSKKPSWQRGQHKSMGENPLELARREGLKTDDDGEIGARTSPCVWPAQAGQELTPKTSENKCPPTVVP